MVCVAELSPHFISCLGPCSLGGGWPGDTELCPLSHSFSRKWGDGKHFEVRVGFGALWPSASVKSQRSRLRLGLSHAPSGSLRGRPAASPAGPSDTQFPGLYAEGSNAGLAAPF